MKLRRTGFIVLLVGILLLAWSLIIWNQSGYDAWMTPFPIAAIAGWFWGWLIFAISVVLLAVDYVRRRRA